MSETEITNTQSNVVKEQTPITPFVHTLDEQASKSAAEYSNMVLMLAKSGTAILATLTPQDCHAIHMCIGLASEYGELLLSEDDQNTTEECGDLEFYFEGLRQGCNISYEEIHVQPAEPRSGRSPLRCIGIAVSELIDIAVKKPVIYRKEIDKVKLIAEMRELNYALSRFYAMHEMSRPAVLNANYMKLSERYKGLQYSDAAAQARADKPAGE